MIAASASSAAAARPARSPQRRLPIEVLSLASLGARRGGARTRAHHVHRLGVPERKLLRAALRRERLEQPPRRPVVLRTAPARCWPRARGRPRGVGGCRATRGWATARGSSVWFGLICVWFGTRGLATARGSSSTARARDESCRGGAAHAGGGAAADAPHCTRGPAWRPPPPSLLLPLPMSLLYLARASLAGRGVREEGRDVSG